MVWTDCPVIARIPREDVRCSRATSHLDVASRRFPNAEMGAKWIAEAHGLAIEDVSTVLAFYEAHHDELSVEYISPERRKALSAPVL